MCLSDFFIANLAAGDKLFMLLDLAGAQELGTRRTWSTRCDISLMAF